MRIAVLGATGMLGRHTAEAVVAAGHELVVVHRTSSRVGDLPGEKRAGDLDDPRSLPEAFEGCDGVIHCAAYYPTVPRPWRREVETARAQMRGFLDATAKLPRVVYLGGSIALPGSTEEQSYESPPADRTPYVQVKWEMDRLAREAKIRIGIPAMTFGEHDKGPTTGRLIVDIANRSLPGYVRGERNVVYAGDAARGLVLVCEKGRAGERYLLTGSNVTMDELVGLIARVAGVEPPTRAIPIRIARAISRMQELRWKLIGGDPPRLSSTAIAVMASGRALDGTKAKTELGYEPRVSLEEAITRALGWFKTNGYVPLRSP